MVTYVNCFVLRWRHRTSTLSWSQVEALNAQGKLLPLDTTVFSAADLNAYSCVASAPISLSQRI